MTDADLDHAYTALCEAMSAAGEEEAMQLLSRFALLAILEIDDAGKVDTLIARAAVRLHAPETQSSVR